MVLTFHRLRTLLVCNADVTKFEEICAKKKLGFHCTHNWGDSTSYHMLIVDAVILEAYLKESGELVCMEYLEFKASKHANHLQKHSGNSRS